MPVAKYANGIQVLGDRYIAVCGGRILREHRSPNSKPVRSKNDETEDAAMPLLDMTSMTWESIKLPSTLWFVTVYVYIYYMSVSYVCFQTDITVWITWR